MKKKYMVIRETIDSTWITEHVTYEEAKIEYDKHSKNIMYIALTEVLEKKQE